MDSKICEWRPQELPKLSSKSVKFEDFPSTTPIVSSSTLMPCAPLFLLTGQKILHTKISLCAHMYWQSAAHACTILGICGALAITLIWIVQNYLQLFLCLVVSINAIHFCMVLRTLTSSNFKLFRIDWPAS